MVNFIIHQFILPFHYKATKFAIALQSMLFDIRQFEHFFEEKILKRGLKLFSNKGIDLIEKHNSTELRFAGAGNELMLKKKGDKLLSYTCSCQSFNYCEHLAASLFFLQKETLGLLPAKKNVNSISKSKIQPNKISFNELLYFTENPVAKTRHGSRLENLLFSITEETCFEEYCQLMNTLLKPYYLSGKLNDQQIAEAHKRIIQFTHKIKGLKPGFRAEYYLNLAVLNELQVFLQLRFTGSETVLLNLKANCLDALEEFYTKKLSVPEKLAWQQALFLSLRNNAVLRSGTYSYLLPRFLSWSRSKTAFDNLYQLIRKRKNTSPYTSRFNPLEVALYQLKIREHQIYKKPMPKTDEESEMMECLANLELTFCSGKIKKGFKLLDEGFKAVLRSHKLYFDEYTAYCLEKAAYHQQTATELFYLEERIVKSLYFKEKELQRWLDLIAIEERELKIKQLIEELRRPKFYSFDKLSHIFKKTQRWDDLIQEIKQHDNAYRLLHEAVLNKFPDFDKNLLLLYIKHFIGAMATIKVYQHQLTLFETAQEYIDKLPTEWRDMVLDKIITHSGSESQLSRHLRRLYGF